MEELDRKIINELQENFPLERHPYDTIARKLGIDTDELWRRITVLMERGAIRRIGFSLDSRSLGYSSTLAAVRIPAEQIEQASLLIAKYPQITHSYLRDHEFCIWFTVIAEDKTAIETILEELRIVLGLTNVDVMNLPVKKMFKLDARFK